MDRLNGIIASYEMLGVRVPRVVWTHPRIVCRP
jgi:hypothetical protein